MDLRSLIARLGRAASVFSPPHMFGSLASRLAKSAFRRWVHNEFFSNSPRAKEHKDPIKVSLTGRGAWWSWKFPRTLFCSRLIVDHSAWLRIRLGARDDRRTPERKFHEMIKKSFRVFDDNSRFLVSPSRILLSRASLFFSPFDMILSDSTRRVVNLCD